MVITASNAREMAARGAIARRKKKEAEALRLLTLEQAVEFGQQNAVPLEHQEQITMLRKHILKVDRMIEACNDAKIAAKLTASRRDLFGMWAHLEGIPKPGSRRPGKAKDAIKTASVAPIEE